jgi:hypothetical protein
MFRTNMSPSPLRFENKSRKKESVNQVASTDILFGLFLDPEDGYVPPKRRLNFKALHGVISKRKIALH